MRKVASKSLQSDYSENPYWISISDLMTGLLIIFILTLSYYILSFSQKTTELAENNIKRANILKSIQKALEMQGIKVKVDLEHGILHLPEGILFDSGKAELKEEGLKLLQKLGPILYEVLTRPEFVNSVETIFIEGHTDNVPIHTTRFQSNWELSTQRAINTWRVLLKITPELKSLKNRNNEPLFTCSGYADTRPVASNNTPEGRRENRRIDFRFSMTSPRIEEKPLIKKIKEKLKVLERQ